jgi:hypothetical protein
MAASTLVDRIRGEFNEMPGLKLTMAQACRLWNVREAICRSAIDVLVSEGFLRETASGAFISLPSPRRMLRIADDVATHIERPSYARPRVAS